MKQKVKCKSQPLYSMTQRSKRYNRTHGYLQLYSINRLSIFTLPKGVHFKLTKRYSTKKLTRTVLMIIISHDKCIEGSSGTYRASVRATTYQHPSGECRCSYDGAHFCLIVGTVLPNQPLLFQFFL